MSLDVFGPSTTIAIAIKDSTQDLGFLFHDGKLTPTISDCARKSAADKIRAWRSRFRHGTIRAVNGVSIHTKAQFREAITAARSASQHNVNVTIAHEEDHLLHTANGIPQLHFDQLNAIAHHLHAIRHGDSLWGPNETAVIQDETVNQATATNLIPVKLTRRRVQALPDWPLWQESEHKQHDSYHKQNMFGAPIPLPPPVLIDGELIKPTALPFVWTYLYKDGLKQKARATCNGGSRYGKAVTLAHTYASCVEQPAARLFYALATLEAMTVVGADASNAFAEAPPPVSPLYMLIDDQFRHWCEHETTAHTKRTRAPCPTRHPGTPGESKTLADFHQQSHDTTELYLDHPRTQCLHRDN